MPAGPRAHRPAAPAAGRAEMFWLADRRPGVTRRRLREWVVTVTLGEALGFAIPATVGAVVTSRPWAPVAVYGVLVAAGLLEGAVLGAAQARLLTRWRILPARGRWILVTALGAGVAWSIGLLPSTLGGLTWTAGTVVLSAAGALVLLTALPTAQYLVLRGRIAGAQRWIPVNVGAWLLGLVWTFAPSPFFDESTPVPTLVLGYAVAGLGMAATVALLTGLGLRRLLGPGR